MFLNGEPGIGPTDAAYSAARVCSKAARFGNGIVAGTPATMLERTRYAAVATAASFEAVAPKRLFSRYGRWCFGVIALTAS
jgi:hypothetical protein